MFRLLSVSTHGSLELKNSVVYELLRVVQILCQPIDTLRRSVTEPFAISTGLIRSSDKSTVAPMKRNETKREKKLFLFLSPSLSLCHELTLSTSRT